LPDPIPIYVYYPTAWADREGVVHFCRDVYNVDKDLVGALKQAQAESKVPDELE
jgi:murein L,D-transpeptidase YcbB/YkuD